jgi:hypothetical protein
VGQPRVNVPGHCWMKLNIVALVGIVRFVVLSF